MIEKFREKLNSKGATLVFVLVTFSIAAILVTLVLLTTLLNIKMKAIDANAKNSFYSCEGAVSEIKAGLQDEVSSAYTSAYIDVMQQYTSTNETERLVLFKNEYVKMIRDSDLKESAADKTHYSLETLKSYIKNTPLKSSSSYGAEVTSITQSGTLQNLLSTVNDGLVLKNVVVKYTDSKGNLSEIRTDIVLEYPNVSFTQTSGIPNLLDFALVAETGIVNSPSATSVINGSLYGGSGISAADGGSLSINNAKVAVTDQTVSVTNQATISTDAGTNLWANAVEVKSAILNLKGSDYLADDTTITDNKGSASKITISGNYYGYGNPDTAQQAADDRLGKGTADANTLISAINADPSSFSSAILVNGTNVSMDFSGVNYLMLGGNAYIGTKLKSTAAYSNTNDILTGESLTVKSNQLAYLVPARYIGENKTNGGQNPMMADTYKALQTELGITGTNDDAMVDLTAIRKLGASGYQKSYYPINNSALVYFYLTFDTETTAANYFNTFYNESASNKEKYDKYTRFYVNEIKASASSSIQYNLNGMILKSVSAADAAVPAIEEKQIAPADEKVSLTERQVSLQNKFAAYKRKLISNFTALTTEERAKTVFANLVKMSDMTAKLAGSAGTNGYLMYTTDKTNLTGIMTEKDVRIVNGQGAPAVGSDGVLVVHTGAGTTVSPYLRVILTTGNVTVSDCAFKGLILSDKTVTFTGNASASAAAEDAAKVLEASRSGEAADKMMNYLYDAASYIVGGAVSGNAGGSSSAGVEDLVVYQNWVKQ